MPDPSLPLSPPSMPQRESQVSIASESVPIKKRTLDQICRELEPLGFPYDVCVSIWHRSHGRIEEAEEYFETYLREQEEERLAMQAQYQKDCAQIQQQIEEGKPRFPLQPHPSDKS